MQAAIRVDNEYSSVLFALKMSMMEIFQGGWEAPNTAAPHIGPGPSQDHHDQMLKSHTAWYAQTPAARVQQKSGNASGERHLGELEEAQIGIFGQDDAPQKEDRTDSMRTLLSVIHTEMREQYSRLDMKIEEHGQTLKAILDAIQSSQTVLHPSSAQAARPPSKATRSLSSPKGFRDSTRSRRFEKYELAGAPLRSQGSTGRAFARAQSGGRGDDETTFDTESLRSEASLATKLRSLLGKRGGGQSEFEGARSPRRSTRALWEDGSEWQLETGRPPHEKPSNGESGLRAMLDVEAGVRASRDPSQRFSRRIGRTGREDETFLPTSGVVRHWLGTRSTLR